VINRGNIIAWGVCLTLFMLFTSCMFIPAGTDIDSRQTAGTDIKSKETAETLSIFNKFIKVEYNKKTSKFDILTIGTNKRFIKSAGFSRETVLSVSFQNVHDEILGSGKSIRLVCGSGNINSITLFPDSPFAFIDKTLVNKKHTAKIVKSVDLLSMQFNINDKRTKSLKVSGTFGLKNIPSHKIGSYLFSAVADPSTNNGIVAGFVKSDRGSGIVFVSKKRKTPVLSAKIDYGALKIKTSAELETFVVGYFDDARIGLEKYADTISDIYNIELKPQPVVYCTWYHLYKGVTEQKFKSNVTAAADLLKKYGLNVVQVDDGWQGGSQLHGTPKKGFSKAAESFPSGMKNSAEFAKKKGFTAGIWYMPFSGDSRTAYYKDKQYLFAEGKNGKPYNVKWGGDAFDLSNTLTLDYVKNLARKICGEWGYKYIKVDGLWSGTATEQKYINRGYSNDHIGASRLSDSEVTHIQAYRKGLKALRDGAGEDVFILGCNLAQNMRTLGASIGLVDGMRIGADNAPGYPEVITGARAGGRLYFLHNRIWHNDPDPLYVRSSIPQEQARLICSWVAVSGQINSSSEDYAALPKDRLKLLRATMPSHNLKPRPVDYFTHNTPTVWSLKDNSSGVERNVIGYFNWICGGKLKKYKWIVPESFLTEFSYSLKQLGLDETKLYGGYELWTDKFITPFYGKLDINVPCTSARVVSLRECQKGTPVLVSTSRHITQGIIDVLSEDWDDASGTLSGESDVVAGDCYEMRLITGTPDKYLICKSVAVSAADKAAGVKISVIFRNNWRLKVKIESPVSRRVNWTLQFKK